MGSFTNIFTGDSILPSWPAYLSLALTANILLGWPTEINAGNGYVVAEIIEVNASSPNLSIQLSPATEIGVGYSFLVNNVGANTVTVIDNLGNTLASISSGQVWQLYCADNTTQQGTWRVFQYGAGVSTANASALAGAGLKAISATLNNRIFVNAQVSNYTVQNSDRASLVEWTGAGAGTFTLPAPSTVGSDWFCYIKNAGGASLVVTPAAGSINSAANQTFQVNDSAIVICDGQNYWTIGFGQSLNSSFNFVTISLAGLSGTYTLSGSNLNRISYKFIGALAGNITVVVPASVQQYWMDNETSGAYTLTISSSGTGGATAVLPQASRNIFYCDGLNIVAAVSGQGVVPTFPDGSAAAPSITFTSDTTLGLYKAGTDTLGIATAGTARGTVNATGNWVLPPASTGTTFSLTGGLSIDSLSASGSATIGGIIYLNTGGTAAAPGAFAFTGDTATGLYQNGLHIIGISADGVNVGNWSSGGLTLPGSAALTVGGTLTVSGTTTLESNVTIDAPANGSSLTVNGLSGYSVSQFFSASATNSVADVAIVRSSSAANVQAAGPNLYLADSSSGASSTFQHSGGQTEIWQSGNQLAFWNANRGLTLNAATGGDTFFVNGTVGITSAAAWASGQTATVTIGDGNSYIQNSYGGPLTLRGYWGVSIAAPNSSSSPALVVDGMATVADDGGTQQIVGFRGLPQNSQQAANYTLQLSDRGKVVRGGASYTYTVPASVFQPGDVVVISASFTSGSLTIAQGTNLTLTWANGSGATTGNRTLTGVGLATIYFDTATSAYISGGGIS